MPAQPQCTSRPAQASTNVTEALTYGLLAHVRGYRRDHICRYKLFAMVRPSRGTGRSTGWMKVVATVAVRYGKRLAVMQLYIVYDQYDNEITMYTRRHTQDARIRYKRGAHKKVLLYDSGYVAPWQCREYLLEHPQMLEHMYDYADSCIGGIILDLSAIVNPDLDKPGAP